MQIARFKDGVQLLINVTKAFIDSQVWDEVNAPNCESFIMDIDLTKEKNLQFIEAMEFAGLVWAEDKERLVPPTGGEEE